MNADEVTIVAAQSVEGYLKNALRRVRVPQEEGGRGTRRRLEMVTSAKIVGQQNGTEDPSADAKVQPMPSLTPAVLVDDDGEEWDVVDVKPQLDATLPSLVGNNVAIKDVPPHDVAVAVELPHKKEEDQQRVGASVQAKEEATTADGAQYPAGALQLPGDEGEDYALQWARPTLTSLGTTNQQSLRHQHSIRSEMIEEREVAKAKAKSERILRVATKITELLVVLQRGTRIMRESHHPRLWKQLLSMRSANANNVRNEKPLPRVLLHAVSTAKRLFADAVNGVVPAAPSLAPCWITQKKDTVGNATSKATTVLLHAIRDNFGVAAVPTEHHNGSGTANDDCAPDAPHHRHHHPLEPLPRGALWTALLHKRRASAGNGGRDGAIKLTVPSPMHLCVVFLALSHLSGIQSRLVIAWEPFPSTENEGEAAPTRAPLMTTIAPRQSKPRTTGANTKESSIEPSPVVPATAQPVATRSYCWTEVWCPIRRSWISVNPSPSHTAHWHVPYALAFGNDGTVVDVTARYTTKYSSVLGRRLEAEHLSLHYIWRAIPKDALGTSFLDVLLKASGQPKTAASCATWARERIQLERLTYAEPLPNTLAALKRHPLYVVEDDVGRWEAVYPKDKQTIVGSIKGLVVYKRSAVVSLRSRDGWLRAGRSLRSAHEEPYKIVKPPPSRPFSNPSHFFGRWQTVPFVPLPLREDGSIDKHGNSTWYILLRGAKAPDGIVHLCYPNIARLARKMHVDFAHAVVAFEKRTMVNGRRGKWDAIIEGIVVPADKAEAVRYAYAEWIELTAQEAAAKQRQRALRWWSHLIQQQLAMDRLESRYEEGERRRKRTRPA